jgi:hypothetical protein
MSNINAVRLLGFNDFFRSEPGSKESYAVKVGKDDIQRLCCLMLTYCKTGHTPSVENIIRMWFQYKGKSYTDSIAFGYVFDEYRRIVNSSGHDNYYLLCEESLLNLYIWATENQAIPESIEHNDGSFMVSLFMLYTSFNDDVLANYDKAEASSKQHADQINMRRIFAERFPQNDLVDIDYGKLVFTQIYKLMELLNFLEATKKYEALYQHFLMDFSCGTKEEFFKALGGAVIIPLNPNKTGINSLVLDNTKQANESKQFLDKLAFEEGDVTLGPTDYKFLRDKPLQKIPHEYRVVFDLFLIKKLYNGLIFKLSGYVNNNPALFKGPFFGGIRDDFSEGVLLYNTMETILSQIGAIKIKGNDFKAAGIEREPDYYCRLDSKVMLLESKDFFMVAADKLSYDFDTIVAGLRVDGRLGKAVLQSSTNVGRVLLQSLQIDGGYDSQKIIVLPIIVVHDTLYNTLGLNYWVNQWFQEKLSDVKAKAEFQNVSFDNVRPITLIDIDTLILYRTNFERGEMDLFEVIELYQKHVQFDKITEKMDENFGRGILPFADFIRNYAEERGIIVDLKLIETLYKESGYVDK